MIYKRSGRKNKGLFLSALLSALCAFISFVPFLFRDGGFFHVWSDFNAQQIPFGMALHNALDGLNIGGWTWNYSTGMSTIQAFSFYALGSPFYWIGLLFPVNWYPYLTGWTYILKYTVAGVTAYCYIRRFTKGENSAVAGALMYAFSAFQTTNLMYYHFHDAAALFPLMLTGLEKILENPRDRWTFVFSVFLNALNNYYFFVMEAVFAAVYFLFRTFGREEKDLRRTGREFLSCVISGLWGMAMAAILLLPSLMYILQSVRADRAVSHSDVFWDLRWLGFTLKGLLLPGDTMVYQSAFYHEEYGSVAAWLPMAGTGLCLAYCLKKRKGQRDWLARMLPVLLILSLSPLLTSVFVLLREVTYRWWFMMALLAALASARVIDAEEEYPVRKSLAAAAAVTAVFCAVVFICNAVWPDAGVLSNPGRFLAFGGIALAGLLLPLILSRAGKLNSRLLTAAVCLFSAGTTFFTMNCYYNYIDFTEQKTNLQRGMQLEEHDGQYRYDLANNQIILTGRGSGLTVFSSTLSRGEKEFDSLFGFGSKNHTLDKSTTPGLTELFAAKYHFAGNLRGRRSLQEIRDEDGNVLHVVEQDACPIGFAVDHYILREQLMTIGEEDRGIAMLYAAVIDPEEEEALADYCTPLLPEEIPLNEDLSGIIAKNTENRVLNFERDNRGFRCTAEYSEPRAVWFSVPEDDGWTAKIDGEAQEILPSAGMMILRVPAGYHEIEFVYCTPGYTAGKIISLLAAATFLLWTFFRVHGRISPLFRR